MKQEAELLPHHEMVLTQQLTEILLGSLTPNLLQALVCHLGVVILVGDLN